MKKRIGKNLLKLGGLLFALFVAGYLWHCFMYA